PSEVLSRSFHEDALRNQGEVAVKTIFLSQAVVESLGNVILFFHSVSPILPSHKQRPTDMIPTHMAMANLLVVLCSGIPHTRVAHSTTRCSTCVLSTYPSFTLIPRGVDWTMLGRRAPKVIGPSWCTCWVVSFLMNIYVSVTVTCPQDMKNGTDTQGKWFSSSSSPSATWVILWSISDAMFIGLVIWSSGSTMFLLHRHHRRLVVTFAIFYVLNSIFAFYISAFVDSPLWLIQTSRVLVSCFPTFSPFLLILRDRDLLGSALELLGIMVECLKEISFIQEYLKGFRKFYLYVAKT
ncbi:hypothetical protein E2I00_013972, partial [Balaenoptera physalus]